MKHLSISLFLLASFLLMFSDLAFSGKIYFYEDENQVKHFTNVPGNNTRYELFIDFDLTSEQLKEQASDIVKKQCEIHDVDYNLAMAVIQAESDFDPWAVSPKGAMGLMQVMPGTLKEMEQSHGFDPEENISAGIKYLAMLLKKYKKNDLALAAYNAGPEAVDKYGGIPPYKETQDYIDKVLKIKNKIDTSEPKTNKTEGAQ